MWCILDCGKGSNLQPARQPEEIEILRAASQLMKRYGDRAAMEAGLRADGRMELGDTFNCELWNRVGVGARTGTNRYSR